VVASPGDPIRILGIDCATRPEKTGLAAGRLHRGELEVLRVSPGKAASPLSWQVSRLFPPAAAQEPVLLALDAPLGWPAAMGEHLGAHQAGRPLEVEPDLFFRRETDRAVRRMHGKTPLEVGADRIARTALAALKLLGELERLLGAPIRLARSPASWRHPAAIEVYPAGTLRANRLQAAGYKSPDTAELRSALLADLAGIYGLHLGTWCHGLTGDPHAFDALICLLAAVDFLEGRAAAPPEDAPVRREGWIWIKAP
jgi:hypothetical protein